MHTSVLQFQLRVKILLGFQTLIGNLLYESCIHSDINELMMTELEKATVARHETTQTGLTLPMVAIRKVIYKDPIRDHKNTNAINLLTAITSREKPCSLTSTLSWFAMPRNAKGGPLVDRIFMKVKIKNMAVTIPHDLTTLSNKVVF